MKTPMRLLRGGKDWGGVPGRGKELIRNGCFITVNIKLVEELPQGHLLLEVGGNQVSVPFWTDK